MKRPVREFQCHVECHLARKTFDEELLVALMAALGKDRAVLGAVAGQRLVHNHRRGSVDVAFTILGHEIAAASLSAVLSVRNALEQTNHPDLMIDRVELSRVPLTGGHAPASAVSATV